MSVHGVAGMLAVTHRDRPGVPPERVRAGLERAGLPPLRPVAGVWMTSWGHHPAVPTAHEPLVLAGEARLDGVRVTDRRVAQLLMGDDHAELAGCLPPFAAVGLADRGVRVATDRMGMGQVFRAAGPGWEAVSTSARLLHRLLDQGLDEEAVLLQSQLGWQLFERTLYAGVTKLAPGEFVTLTSQGLRRRAAIAPPAAPGSVRLDDAVEHASTVLRRFTAAFLDDTADPLLQLTGGMDSRIVLSAVPSTRRRGLRAMTLDVPGSADASVARSVAERCGLVHQVVTLQDLGSVPAQEWFTRVRSTAEEHDGMLNPVAKAATEWVEESVEQGSRLGGLGGEVARGFYYVGPVRRASVGRGRSERLARWRMLANEAVAPEALHPRHRGQARAVALDAIHAALTTGGEEWFSATDDLYYRHRMPRWAGLAESVASTRRAIVNPMLDPRFIGLARDLAPRDKGGARFLARLQLELDRELAGMPLENRPPPEVYAHPGPSDRLGQMAARARAGLRKARQRATGARRPPAGGTVVAAAVVEHLREHPNLLDPVRESGWFDQGWLTDMLSGSVTPGADTVAFLINMLVALDAGEGDG